MTPTKDEKRRLDLWKVQISAAWKVKEQWEKDYQCSMLEEFVLGFQRGEDHNEAYVVNLCKPIMLARLASIVFPYPKTTVSAKPAKADDPMSNIEERSNVLEDTADFLCRDYRSGYKDSHKLALIEAHYRVGWIESGYDMDIISNPNAGKVITEDADGEKIIEPVKIPREPKPYFRWIPASTVLVPASSDWFLERNEWIGYYQWERLDLVKANESYENTKDLESASVESAYGDDDTRNDSGYSVMKREGRGRLKVWHIWNLWERKSYVFPESYDRFFVDGKPYKTCPISDYKGFPILGQYWPVPIAADWVDSQLEINERREQERVHARRSSRIYKVRKGRIEESERAKLENAQDGSLIELGELNDLGLLEMAPHDSSVQISEAKARQDLAEITNVGAEQRQNPSGETTATAAAISEQRLRMREEDERVQFAETLACSIKKMLLITIERRALPLWIKVNVDRAGPQAYAEASRIRDVWKQINLKDYDSLEFDIEIGIESMPPDTSDSAKNRINQLLPLIANPQTAGLLAMDPFLLRWVLRSYNIRSERQVAGIRLTLARIYGTAQAAQEIEAFVSGAGTPGVGAGGGGQPALPAAGGAPPTPGSAALLPTNAGAAVPTGNNYAQLAKRLGIPIGGES